MIFLGLGRILKARTKKSIKNHPDPSSQNSKNQKINPKINLQSKGGGWRGQLVKSPVLGGGRGGGEAPGLGPVLPE